MHEGDWESGLEGPEEEPTGPVPSEAEMVIISLLMRLYDVNMALLNSTNEALADSIYEAHEEGRTFNPPVFIPAVVPDAHES